MRTGRTFDEFLRGYLEGLTPEQRAVYDEKARWAVAENRRICSHREWYTSDPPICVACGLVGDTD